LEKNVLFQNAGEGEAPPRQKIKKTGKEVKSATGGTRGRGRKVKRVGCQWGRPTVPGRKVPAKKKDGSANGANFPCEK